MVFRYFPETDMLYIQLIDTISMDSEEVAPNIVLDFDEKNRVIGIEIADASEYVDLSTLEISAVPIINLVLNKQQAVGAA